jgi:hypothetical protein
MTVIPVKFEVPLSRVSGAVRIQRAKDDRCCVLSDQKDNKQPHTNRVPFCPRNENIMANGLHCTGSSLPVTLTTNNSKEVLQGSLVHVFNPNFVAEKDVNLHQIYSTDL